MRATDVDRATKNGVDQEGAVVAEFRRGGGIPDDTTSVFRSLGRSDFVWRCDPSHKTAAAGSILLVTKRTAGAC